MIAFIAIVLFELVYFDDIPNFVMLKRCKLTIEENVIVNENVKSNSVPKTYVKIKKKCRHSKKKKIKLK